jgi:hypothetical protein
MFCEVFIMDYLTTKQAAEKWHISPRRVQVLCEQGRIKGAVRLGWAWAIPKDAEKPEDARRRRKAKEKLRRENDNVL